MEKASLPSTRRQIRVFISSTFRDMQAERDHLVKFIFPQLRKLCESRGVTWGEVDLRWGVTDEQAAEGKVLPICLEEIKRCRPYFIGLLGERYGWVPESIPEELLEKEEWLREQFKDHKSVTELETLHGVLNEPKMAGHAFFYFRDPKYLETLSEADKKAFTAENPKDAEKLHTLKENIRRSEFPVRENYPDPKALGEFVLTDLTKVINELFPEGSKPDPLDREAMDHEAYAQSRERVYIGRQEYFDRLDTHAAANDTQPIVVLGESGSGKSALLANWVARYRQAHPDVLVLQHYIGATPYSADWAAMLRRLMGEFKRRLGLQQDIPDQSDALRSAFPNWLYMANAKVESSELRVESPDKTADTTARPRKIVIVLDALNQLENRDGAPDLVWLPPVLPENVRLILSALPGRSLDETQKRHWPTLEVELLSADERRKLITEYLAQHAKSLHAARVERIATAPPSANPLYLRVLLDELRLVRTHEELEEHIGDYLKAESPYALYEKVIARWEQDYEGDADLVGDTLSMLWAARRGLTETELLQALGKDGEPLPRAKWSPLFLAMSDALISRGGLLTFAHDFLRTAVKNVFLPTEQNQQAGHLRLADYFERQPASPRRNDELPWQLREAKHWQRLETALSTHQLFFALCNGTSMWELTSYWHLLRSNGADLEQCYATAYSMWEENDKDISKSIKDGSDLGQFLKNCGCNHAAEKLLEGTLKRMERALGIHHVDAIECRTRLAEVHMTKGDHSRAEALLRQVWLNTKDLFGANDPRTIRAGNDLAVCLMGAGDFTSAEQLFRETVGIADIVLRCDDGPILDYVANWGRLLIAREDFVTAEPLVRRALTGFEKSLGPEHPKSLLAATNLGVLLKNKGDFSGAEPFLWQALSGFERVLGPEHSHTLGARANLANLFADRGDYRTATALLERSMLGLLEAAYQNDHDLEHFQAIQRNLIIVLKRSGLTEQEAIARVEKALEDYCDERDGEES